jgi:hypothetical protein
VWESNERFAAAVCLEWDDDSDADDLLSTLLPAEAQTVPAEDEIWREFGECFGPPVPRSVIDRITHRVKQIAAEDDFICWRSSKDKSPVPLSRAPPLSIHLKKDAEFVQPRVPKMYMNEEDEKLRTGLLETMVEGGWIDPNVKPKVCSPVIVVHPPNKKARAVIDCRGPNAVTEPGYNAAPFTPMEIAEKTAGAGLRYSMADGAKMYNQYAIAV